MSGFEPGQPPPGQGGPGWWLASDGRWYPPEQAPGVEHPPPGQPPQAGPPPYAGQPPQPGPPPYAGYGPPPSVSPSTSNGMAIAALVLGIVSIVICWLCGLGVVAGVLAVVFGILGLKRAKALPGRPSAGLATAGIVTGAIGAVLSVGLLLLIIVSAIADDDDGFNSDPSNGICNEDRYYQDPDC